MTHVVLLGAEVEAIHDLAAAGCTITVLYKATQKHRVDACAAMVAHSGYIESYQSPEMAWSLLLHLGITGQVDVVVPAHELAVATAAMLNRVLGLDERIDPAAAMAGRDKALQKSLWAHHGVPTSRFATVTETPGSVGELAAALAGLTPPFVVKPPAGGGSTLVLPCADVPAAFATLSRHRGLRHAMVEERQDGPEWHIDGTLEDGRITHLMVSRYLAPLIETKFGLTLRSVAFPPSRYTHLYADARKFAEAATSALGGRWGAFHLEAFGGPGEFVAGELAWRPPGVLASMSARHTIGVSLWAAHAHLLTGTPVTVTEPEADTVFGFVCLPVLPGHRNGVSQQDLERLPGVRHIRMKIELGQLMGEMVTSTTCVAMALLAGSSIDECERRIDEAVRLTDELHRRQSTRDETAA